MIPVEKYRHIATFKNKLHKYVPDKNVIPVRILNVNYAHQRYENGDDLYVTQYGLPYYKYLDPINFLNDKDWFRDNSIRLSGSGTTYKITTKRIMKKSNTRTRHQTLRSIKN